MNRILTPFEQALKSAEIDARARKALEPLWNRVSGTLICSTCKQILGNYGVEDENEINYYATPAGKAHIMERKCESGQHPAQVEYTISPTIPQLPHFLTISPIPGRYRSNTTHGRPDQRHHSRCLRHIGGHTLRGVDQHIATKGHKAHMASPPHRYTQHTPTHAIIRHSLGHTPRHKNTRGNNNAFIRP